MRTYQAPAKLNLALLVHPPRTDGLHPLESMVQTIDWLDTLDVSIGEGNDILTVADEAVEVVEVEDNLVLKGVAAVRRQASVPPLAMRLDKRIPVAAGLGGGSSDAAAALVAALEAGGHELELASVLAPQVGADVSLFLFGGTLMVTGVGESIEPLQPLEGFAMTVVVPEFGLSTATVYRRWDEMEGPTGEVMPDSGLPPQLRSDMPMRNDLLPAALDLEPRLGDFMADLRALWGTAVGLTGSGSACFAYFPETSEAAGAAATAEPMTSARRVVTPRPTGVSSV